MSEFPDLESAFARLRTAAPVPPPPGPDAVRETVRRRRRGRWALAAVLVLLTGAGLGWLIVLDGDPDTARIVPGVRPAAPSTSPAGPARGLDPSDIYPDFTIEVPARPGGCPAATLRFRGGGQEVTVGGVRYRTGGESAFGFGDLTGDGHDELAVIVSCGSGRWMLLVQTATGPGPATTLAAGVLPGPVVSVDVGVHQRITTFSSRVQNAEAMLHVYGLRGDGTLIRWK
ncbi:hypothetical protein [Cryptosporangium aurantiacum]|uniref:VCBS repeat-containing protein n=1 Tax=Cryptosporangium aurantiacum TaxID=134849 RepID=A0A1M7RBN6_9ACTN|nr:hypothetical protein [Cryptosporangium aurantiacum]SHN43549.1 hypothetical protein SAMN05443668_109224 [Cryptosporangium aurantiacum]